VVTVAVAFVVIDFAWNRDRRASILLVEHDKNAVKEILVELPANGPVIYWLKENFIAQSVPIAYTDILEDVHRRMSMNVVGLDNSKAARAFRKLKDAIGQFNIATTSNLFSNEDHTVAQKSRDWPQGQWDEAKREILENRDRLVRAYDQFVLKCHQNKLY
jgi:hypothetical protein